MSGSRGGTDAAPNQSLPERHRLGVSVLFTAFEGGMPIIGLALGAPLGRAIGSSADYIAIAVLIGFGRSAPGGRSKIRHL
jgi:putative Mn2+ efflux pump MntP